MQTHRQARPWPIILGSVAIASIILFYTVQALRSPSLDTTESNGPLNDQQPDAPVVAASDLLRDPNPQSYALIDVRSEDEYRTEHIVDSSSKPLELITSSPIPNSTDTSSRIIIVGSALDESVPRQAGRLLLASGLKAVFILKGGIEEWKSQGGRTISQGDPESFVDQSKIIPTKPEQLKADMDKGAFLAVIDMRPADIFAQGHVTGAINLPLAELENRYSELPAGKPIVAYGNSALEDFQAGVRLFDLHFLGAKVLEGGFNAWKNKGFPVEK